jgi:hypothetical protein
MFNFYIAAVMVVTVTLQVVENNLQIAQLTTKYD